MSETRVEWGVLFEYDSEVEPFGDEDKARRYAEWFQTRPDRGHATVVHRTVTVGEWEPTA